MLEREVSMLRAQCGSGCCGESSAMGDLISFDFNSKSGKLNKVAFLIFRKNTTTKNPDFLLQSWIATGSVRKTGLTEEAVGTRLLILDSNLF